jgi:hypothetical protein
MSYESERLKILEMIDNGLITVEEGVDLLNALGERGGETSALPEQTDATQAALESEGAREVVRFVEVPEENLSVGTTEPAQPPDAESRPAAETVHAPQPEPSPEEKFSAPTIDPGLKKWRRFWWIPFWVGVGITVISAVLMYAAWDKGGFGFWFACTWFPFALGVLVMALAYASRTARWLHVRVHQSPGEKPQNISISMPIPLRLTAWFFRTFKGRIPHMENTGIDELIMALETTNPDTPFYVEVNEGDDGEKVEVYIG